MPGSFTKRLLDELKKGFTNSGMEELVGKISKTVEDVLENAARKPENRAGGKNSGQGGQNGSDGKSFTKNSREDLNRKILGVSEWSEFRQKDIEPAKKEEIKRELQRFKMGMLQVMPFYGDILMRVEIREDLNIETAQTNGRMISYNPAFFASLNEGQRNYVLLHEVLHILLFHWKRNAERNPVLWNIACDYVVNGMIDSRIMKDLRRKNNSVKLERPPQGCFERWYYGKSAEEYYQDLFTKLKKYLDDSDGSTLASRRVIMIDDAKIRIPMDLKGAAENDRVKEAEAEVFVKGLIRDTIKRRGSGSCHISEQLIKLTETRKLPWDRLLLEYLEVRDEEESSYLTPERKYIHMDLIIPGMAKTDEKLDEIWAFVDSSGSIGGNDLNRFMTQLYRISREFECTFNIAFWDTVVTDVFLKVSNKEKVLECKPKHSGGTDINCVYNYIRKQKLKPEVILILTDGYFGNVNDTNRPMLKKLRKKTIFVISEDGTVADHFSEMGKVARL